MQSHRLCTWRNRTTGKNLEESLDPGGCNQAKAAVTGLHLQLELELLQVNTNDISRTFAQGKAGSLGAQIPPSWGKFHKLYIAHVHISLES